MSIDKKTLDRIQKLLAMTESPNDNEASIARRRVDAILESLNLTEDDILEKGRYTQVVYNTKDKSTATWKIQMYTNIAFILGCSITYMRKSPELTILGRGGRPEIVAYIFSIVERNMVAEWKAYREQYKELNGHSPRGTVRTTWHKYFGIGVCQKSQSIYSNLSTEEQQELQVDLKEAAKQAPDARVVTRRQREDKNLDVSVARAAYTTGTEQNLNIGLGTNSENNQLEVVDE